MAETNSVHNALETLNIAKKFQSQCKNNPTNLDHCATDN